MASPTTTVEVVELNLVRMPLGKLQRPSGFTEYANQDYPRFLYDDSGFSEGVSSRQLRERPMSVVLGWGGTMYADDPASPTGWSVWRPLPGQSIQIDHFVPWSRMANDGLTNLVASDNRCNNRNGTTSPTWSCSGAGPSGRPRPWPRPPTLRWPLRRRQSLRIARGLYAHLPQGTHLWQQRGVFTLLDRDELGRVLPYLDE